jgi:hypothetical protein
VQRMLHVVVASQEGLGLQQEQQMQVHHLRCSTAGLQYTCCAAGSSVSCVLDSSCAGGLCRVQLALASCSSATSKDGSWGAVHVACSILACSMVSCSCFLQRNQQGVFYDCCSALHEQQQHLRYCGHRSKSATSAAYLT